MITTLKVEILVEIVGWQKWVFLAGINLAEEKPKEN